LLAFERGVLVESQGALHVQSCNARLPLLAGASSAVISLLPGFVHRCCCGELLQGAGAHHQQACGAIAASSSCVMTVMVVLLMIMMLQLLIICMLTRMCSATLACWLCVRVKTSAGR
jgi:hypothetical protein